MKLTRTLSLIFAAALAASTLTACAGNTSEQESSAPENPPASNGSTADSSAEQPAYSPENPVTVKIGLTGNVYEDIWDPIKEKLAPEGIILEYEQFTAFNIPNNALNSGEIDINAFQHHAYFNNDTATNGYDLAVLGDTYIVAMNIYGGKLSSIDEALKADKVKIAVPNDVTNEGRALKLLSEAGFFTLSETAGASPEISDIEQYTVEIEFVEVDANLVPTVKDDVDIAVINGNYALDAGLTANDAIYK
ncbi:MAG: MetQ/NlpA family ABC transporter substrate-binding protein, partial [Oscillospiraceae bacterium]|nr:MetQ/NlpA family ABC transporter substrate-binding protein [Oscillospiraceae bacterium]